jgi:uncharacterized protein YlxW (UPF0749 family)
MKPTWLDGVSILLLTAALTAGVWQHLPLAAPWALAFAIYIALRVGRDVFTAWREEQRGQRIYNAQELGELSKQLRTLQALADEVKAERIALQAHYASLEADVRTMQGQTNMAQTFGGGFGIGPSFGPTRGG